MPPPTLNDYLNQRVVLDTQGPLIYIGRLVAVDDRGYWLTDADVHDRSDGHSPKEVYINEARALDLAGQRRVNRRRVFVERHAVIGVSALGDVVSEDQTDEDDAGEAR
jgi:small nuclear ribonucleoprotein (snRNP)-like protein